MNLAIDFTGEGYQMNPRTREFLSAFADPDFNEERRQLNALSARLEHRLGDAQKSARRQEFGELLRATFPGRKLPIDPLSHTLKSKTDLENLSLLLERFRSFNPADDINAQLVGLLALERKLYPTISIEDQLIARKAPIRNLANQGLDFCIHYFRKISQFPH